MKSIFHSIKLLAERVQNDKIFQIASSLTYQSLLALVPLLAIMFGVAKGFNLDKVLETSLKTNLKEQQEVAAYLLQCAQSALKEAQGGLIASLGVFFLLFTSINLLSSVEEATNTMWGKTSGRSYWRKASDYTLILLICPFLLIVSSSLTVFITAELSSWISSFSFMLEARPYLLKLLDFAPYVTSWLLFSLLLFSMPCAPVRLLPSFLAGGLAAISFQLIQSWYIILQLRFTKMSAVYGSFVAIPLFLVWLWLSWIVILLASELVIFFQEKGYKTSLKKSPKGPISHVELQTSILSLAIKKFKCGKTLSLSEICQKLSISIKDALSTIEVLQKKSLLLNTGKGFRDISVVPTQNSFSITPLELMALEDPDTSRLTTWKTMMHTKHEEF